MAGEVSWAEALLELRRGAENTLREINQQLEAQLAAAKQQLQEAEADGSAAQVEELRERVELLETRLT